MPIPKSFIQQLLLHCEIEDVISSYVVLKREGHNQKGLCPFHSEKTPSMVVYNDTQSFYCFGCGTGGDVITFMMKIENLDYIEAIKLLAQRVGLEVPEDAAEDAASHRKTRVLEMNRAAALFFHNCLKTPEGRNGLTYLKNRRLDNKMIVKYGLGFAPAHWDALLKHLQSKGFSLTEIEAAKLAVKGKNGSYYDFFRNRVIFPVIDLRGNVIAFGGRVLDDSKPKYLNSPDTPVFKKSRNLFSLNFAKNVKTDSFILAEGYMDVIAIHAAGFENVVATLGTSLTAEQARLISKYVKEVIIAYDSDGAGQTATHRAINLFSEVNVSTRTLKLENAKDPDEFIQKFGAKRFEILLQNSGNVVEFELSKLRQQYPLEDTNHKIEFVRRAVSLISSIQNPIERDIYAGNVSRETGVSMDTIKSQIAASIKRRNRAKDRQEWLEIQSNKKVLNDRINPEKQKYLKTALAEEGIIAFLFSHPDHLTYILSKIQIDDFATEFNRRVFRTMAEILTNGEELSLSFLIPLFTSEENNKISEILATKHKQKQTKQLIDDYIDVLLTHKNSLKTQDIKNLDLAEIERYRQQKRTKTQ